MTRRGTSLPRSMIHTVRTNGDLPQGVVSGPSIMYFVPWTESTLRIFVGLFAMSCKALANFRQFSDENPKAV